jgi:hypothetical protein
LLGAVANLTVKVDAAIDASRLFDAAAALDPQYPLVVFDGTRARKWQRSRRSILLGWNVEATRQLDASADVILVACLKPLLKKKVVTGSA